MLIIDAANVVGSRPTGWWRDRAGAAHVFVEQVRAATLAGRLTPPVVVVLEGAARPGVAAGSAGGVDVVHARGEGDDAIAERTEAGGVDVVVVTADRGLRRRVEAAGGAVVGPTWLYDRLE